MNITLMNIKGKKNEVYKTDYYISKYIKTRHHAKDLFRSEKYFLPRILEKNMKILDVGCACGGFYNILKSFENSISYTGIDISKDLIEQASELYPEGNFNYYNPRKYDFTLNTYDLVQSWGVMLHEPNYKILIQNLWKSVKKTFVFDIRGQMHTAEIIDKNKSFVLNPGGIKNYYIINNLINFIYFICSLNPSPSSIEIFGYLGKPNIYTNIPDEVKDVYMCSIKIDKNPSLKNKKQIILNLPKEISIKIQRDLLIKNNLSFDIVLI